MQVITPKREISQQLFLMRISIGPQPPTYSKIGVNLRILQDHSAFEAFALSALSLPLLQV